MTAQALEMASEYNLTSEMPASVEAERSIFGAVLLNNGAWTEAAKSLCADDFSLDSHRRLYRAMVDMVAASTPIDPITLIEELKCRRELESVGDVAYVSSLMDGVPDRPSIEHYVRIVKGKAQLRALIFAAQAAITRATSGDTAAEVASGLLEQVLEVEAQSRSGRVTTPRDFMPEVIRELELQAGAGGLVGLPTGLSTLDQLTGGLRRGELIVIGALPGSGKTALACQIVAANAEADNPVGVFSIEMSRWDLGKRFLSSVTSVSASKIRHPGHIAKDDWLALAAGAAKITSWPVWFDDSGTISVPELLARARLLISRMKVKLLVVDYLQLVRADARDIRERVGKVADALRQLAKTERIPIVLLSQLRRPQNVNDSPTMLDLKESGDIECHAHVVLLLHAPTDAGGKPSGEDTIIIGKNRNGAKGPVPATFNPHRLRFYPRSDEQREEQVSGRLQ